MPTKRETGMPRKATQSRTRARFSRRNRAKRELDRIFRTQEYFSNRWGSRWKDHPPKIKPFGKPEIEMDKTDQGEDQQQPGSQGHDRIGLDGDQEFPKKGRALQIEDQAKDPDQERKRSDIGPDPADLFIFFFSEKISQGGN